MSERKDIPSAEAVKESEPRIVTYEGGPTALVFDQPGDKVTIGSADKYFRDPQLSAGILEFRARRDDGTQVRSYVTQDKIVVVRLFPESKPVYEVLSRSGDGADAVPVGNDIHNQTFTIGEPTSLIPGYGRGDMVLQSVAAEYKIGGNSGSGKSPFEAVRAMLKRRQERKARIGGVAVNSK